MEDTIVQMRDYTVFATDEEDAVKRIAEGFFLTEGEAATIDHVGESRVKSVTKVTDSNED